MPPQTSGRPLDARNQQGSAAPERSGRGPATRCSGGSGAPANPGGIARCARDEQQRDPPSSAADGARRTCAARRAGRLDTHLGAHGHVDDGCTPMRPEAEISPAENIGWRGAVSNRRSGCQKLAHVTKRFGFKYFAYPVAASDVLPQKSAGSTEPASPNREVGEHRLS